MAVTVGGLTGYMSQAGCTSGAEAAGGPAGALGVVDSGAVGVEGVVQAADVEEEVAAEALEAVACHCSTEADNYSGTRVDSAAAAAVVVAHLRGVEVEQAVVAAAGGEALVAL